MLDVVRVRPDEHVSIDVTTRDRAAGHHDSDDARRP
jgi:hypothetical protein